jgi:hypothetical protein
MTNRREESIQLKLELADPDERSRLEEENRLLRLINAKLTTENERLKLGLESSTPSVIENNTDLILTLENGYQSVNWDYTGNRIQVTKRSSIEDKIALFRNYFRGRDDVYAVRGADKSGKAAYYTKRKSLGKENGTYIWGENLPLTDEIIMEHLTNEKHPIVVGLYPLLLDETCWFLAIDFDKSSWMQDVAAFLDTCRSNHVPVALERSRSGNGGHVWIFFEEPVAARTARMLGSTLLTLTLEKRHQVGLDSYDRMFPNQDTLPKEKKLGNLIALPLQRIAGRQGNSLLIDESL